MNIINAIVDYSLTAFFTVCVARPDLRLKMSRCRVHLRFEGPVVPNNGASS